MSRPLPRSDTMSLDDFDAMLEDQPDDERWELIEGRVLKMMVGARWEHNRIISNLHFELVSRFRAKNSPCRVFAETFRMREQALRSSLMPDIIVACRPLAPGATSLSDPIVIVEVLSDSTRKRDRDDKRRVYQQLPSLQHYAIVARSSPSIEILDRSESGWTSRTCVGLSATLALPALALEIPLSQIYADLFS